MKTKLCASVTLIQNHSWECTLVGRHARGNVSVFQVCQRGVEQRHSSHFSQIMSQTSRSGSGNLVTTPDLTKLLRDVEATGFSRDSVDLAQVFKGQEAFTEGLEVQNVFKKVKNFFNYAVTLWPITVSANQASLGKGVVWLFHRAVVFLFRQEVGGVGHRG